ncbi:MAG: chorismate mutase [Candidatus Bathyarchaeum sp.]|nr:MAG: chorismate mutase [Candidatus Bathyarchaeum sp.]
MESIAALRNKIDEIDKKIILLLKDRIELCKRIGAVKRENGISVRDLQREDQVYLHVMGTALEVGLDPQKVENIFKGIIALSVFVQGAE